MFYDLGRMNLLNIEGHRCPIRLELARHVVPMGIFIFFVALSLGYAWARAVYCG